MNKVLMIEDEEDIVRFFEKTFQYFKQIQFFYALRAFQGMELARKEKPDVILLDLRMPGMNGEEALKELKQDLPASKFLVVTAWDDGQTKARILNDIGVEGYFEKPVDLEKIIDKIMDLVKARPS